MSAGAVRTKPREVAPRQIPDALRTIWRDCCAAAEHSVTRSLTHNFVAVVDQARAAELHAVVDELAQRRPCRAFFVVVAPDGDAMHVEVAGAARQQGNLLVLLLERIDLRTPLPSFQRVPGIVRPLLVNDIPTHLYWGCDWPGDERRFDQLAAMVDHVVLDSARWPGNGPWLDGVETRRTRGLHVTDLNWLRLHPWRRALAEGFEWIRYEPAWPTTVGIRHGQLGAAGARLLARWLAQRLHAQVRLEPSGEETAGLQAVDIRHGHAEIHANALEPTRIEVRVTTADACYLPLSVPASRGNETSLLAAAIDLA